MLRIAALAVMLAWGRSALAAGPPSGSEAMCDYGITVALLGQTARAESVFIALLSRSRGDPRALNNLGNVALLRGEPELALSYYGRAAATDTLDGGIVLNEATALTLMGDDESARERAAEGIRLAGGPHAAGYLLGLQYSGAERAKASRQAYLSKDELEALLRVAAGRVPTDSVRVVPDSTATNRVPHTRHVPVWRSAGARAGDQDAAALVYWKR
jgi:tetratricopeptide (TPR) repeat protein